MQSAASVAGDVDCKVLNFFVTPTSTPTPTLGGQFRTSDSNANSGLKNLDSDSGPKIFAQNQTPIATLRTDCVTYSLCIKV